MLGLTVDPQATIDKGFDIVGSISSNDTPLTTQNLELNNLPLFTSMQNAIADVGGWTGLTTNIDPNTTNKNPVTPMSWATLGLVVVGLVLIAEIAGKHGR